MFSHVAYAVRVCKSTDNPRHAVVIPATKHLSRSEPDDLDYELQTQGFFHLVHLIRSDAHPSKANHMLIAAGVEYGDKTRGGCPHYCRVCQFSNVCLNHSSLEIQFYRGEDKTPLYYSQTGAAHYNFPTGLVTTGRCHLCPGSVNISGVVLLTQLHLTICALMRDTILAVCMPAGHIAIQPSKMNWSPRAVSQSVPNGAHYSKAPVTAFVSLNDYAGNFGHAMWDFMYPVFNTVQLVNLYTPDFQLLLAEHQV